MLRRCLRVPSVVSAALLLVAVWAQPLDAQTSRLHLVILHLNDAHGQLEPLAQPGGGSVGGMARIATLVRRARAENPDRVLFLHAGDQLSKGGPLTIWYGGDVDLRVMNRLRLDALTPGNGEFYFGFDNLQRLAQTARFPLLHANVVARGGGAWVLKPYVAKRMAGVRVVILGLGAVRMEHPSARALGYRDPLAVARRLAPEVARQADLVIALSHLGLDADRRLAAAAPEIDLIVGGHSHSRLGVPLRVPRPGREGETVIAQAGDATRFLGRIEVDLRRQGRGYRVERIEGRLVPVGPEVPEDAGLARLLGRYRAPLDAPWFTSAVALPNPERGPSPAGAFVAEALRAETRADAALLDRGGVAAALKPGPGTLADLCRLHPWRNHVLLAPLTGAQLQRELASEQVHWAGCTFRRNGSAVEDLAVGGRPVQPTKRYRVAVGDYLFRTTPSLRDLPAQDTGEWVHTLLARHVRGRVVVGLSPALPRRHAAHRGAAKAATCPPGS